MHAHIIHVDTSHDHRAHLFACSMCWSEYVCGAASVVRLQSGVQVDPVRRMFDILRKEGCRYVAPDDLKSMMAGILLSHPGLEFLQETPEFQDRYCTVQQPAAAHSTLQCREDVYPALIMLCCSLRNIGQMVS